VERDGRYVAYEVFGNGPRDILAFQVSAPLDLMWELPQLASFLETLGSMGRVIMYDAPGQGASDPLAHDEPPTLETACDLALAVLEVAHAQRVTFFDMSVGTTGALFAAMFPQHVRSLIANNLRPSFPEIARMTPAQLRSLALARAGIESLDVDNPRVAHDPVLRQWWGRARRLLSSPQGALALLEMSTRINIEAVLPSVHVPTLVLSRSDNQTVDIETSRAAASRIPNARFVELPGAENDIFLGDTAPVLAEIGRFLAEPELEARSDRTLVTVLFTDMVSSTEHLAAAGDQAWRQFLDDHDQTVNRIVADYRGKVVKSTGDGVLATFDGPNRAVRCAAEILDVAERQGITLRAGLHTGEIELRPGDVTGIAVHIASRIASLAHGEEILVSRTVVDLTSGSGLQFEPRGEYELKGVPGTWPTFSAQVPA